jgi:fatty-acyl-CoA synthase
MFAGRMMDFPLTVTHLLDRARTFFPQTEVVSRRPDGSIKRVTYGEVAERSARLAGALARLGVKPGDRVATLCWNHHEHLEVYFAVPCMGAVVHTLNIRLHPSELGYIIRHAEDTVAIVDRSLLKLWKAVDAPTVRHLIVVEDDGPTTEGTSYESLIASGALMTTWPELDEKQAAMLCYTSGTTGNPKGVLYSHRSSVLHTLSVCQTDALAVSQRDVIMPVVPMFHANAWGLPYAAAMTGAKLVFPGPRLDATSLVDLIAGERVSIAAGVPTIWLGLLAHLDANRGKQDLSCLRTTVIGGSAAPPALIDGFGARHGIEVLHAWGMTEMSPLGTVARPRAGTPVDKQLGVRSSQGYAVPLVETRVVADDGKALPWDGETMGELEVRGPFVAASYFGGEGADRFTADGWFKTGDVVTIDRDGYVRITDRSKDVIKSGGEWISSVALENALMAHPSVLEAAVFAAKDPKWDERPVAAIVFKPDARATEEELTAHLAAKVAKFWLPDRYVFVDQIPRTSTGKFLKSKLREEYGDVLTRSRT